uniref:NADH dehydrogenase subunit 3 n=1 Tax=Ophiothrix exigua TaxID=1815227 RepID=UPI00286A72BF|nr:NADH dehydrogenase subunit 3 [Ophiothrix exigua]WKW95561.1 NADH dehydrogenase subunit 3 [Ophiothrix exigua]
MLTIFIIFCLLLTAILIIIGKTLPHTKTDLNKSSPYECGFDPINSARLPFSFRFFIVAILFLIFDLEIALLVATPFFFSNPSASDNAIFILLFLLVLIAGLWYEWENDGLEWVCLNW